MPVLLELIVEPLKALFHVTPCPDPSSTRRAVSIDPKGPSINNRVIIATDREDLLSGIHNDGSRDVAWWDDSSRSGARRAEALSRDGPCSE
jgi:hypothetical protein